MPKNQGSTDLQLFALRLAQFLEVVIQAQLRELVLQVDPKVHVLDRVDDDVDELHAGHHELNLELLGVGEERDQRLEPVGFAHLLKNIISLKILICYHYKSHSLRFQKQTCL